MGFQFNHVGGGTKTRRPITLHMKYNSGCVQPTCYLMLEDVGEQEVSLEELQVRACAQGLSSIPAMHPAAWRMQNHRLESSGWGAGKILGKGMHAPVTLPRTLLLWCMQDRGCRFAAGGPGGGGAEGGGQGMCVHVRAGVHRERERAPGARAAVLVQGDRGQDRVQVLPQPHHHRHPRSAAPFAKLEMQ